jgi:hypothetical protein
LPTSPKDEVAIAKLGKIYTVCAVKARPGHRSGQSDRKALKAVLANDEFIAELVTRYGQFIGDIPGPQRRSVKAFTGWLKGQLAKPDSRTHKAAKQLAPVLLEVMRSDRWWESAIADRRKRRVKDI